MRLHASALLFSLFFIGNAEELEEECNQEHQERISLVQMPSLPLQPFSKTESKGHHAALQAEEGGDEETPEPVAELQPAASEGKAKETKLSSAFLKQAIALTAKKGPVDIAAARKFARQNHQGMQTAN
eukprot:TRINITY_DN9814_c0_g1_i2.p1 TRINITY_DN9814_c0_g1~~TRINITY_DN9814_c0_g1_i2.p1  ORF type:complete len:128 (+),score=39.21 TRINITY_DN9814_c0_g1_i2:75-458(+)